MIKIEVSFVILSIFFLYIECVDGQCTSIEPTPEEESQVVDIVQELGRKISYAQWNKNSSMNVVLSPLSINIILNLLMAATGGETSTEIKLFLGYESGLDECEVHKIFQNFFNSLHQQSGNEVEISLYTKLFPKEGFQILDSYLTISKTYYFSDVQNVGYTSDATNTINQWVFNNTKGKIEKLFELLPPDTVLVIANVIFFNASWVNKFPSSATENGIFETEAGNIIIPMMTSSLIQVPYLRDSILGVEIISLPYDGNQYSMYIIKPTDGPSKDKLKEIENMIDANQLDNLINKMQPTYLTVKIPRMKLNSDFELKEDFQNFGINKIFGGADFTRMTSESNLFVSKIKHKAIIEVTEDGTTAAAVTGAVISLPSASPPIFTLNIPSLLLITNNNGLILFYVRVMNPEPYWP